MISLPIPAPLFHEGLNPLGAGNFQMSMIHIEDVASIFFKSLDNLGSVSIIILDTASPCISEIGFALIFLIF